MSEGLNIKEQILAHLKKTLDSAYTRHQVISVLLDLVFYHLKPEGALIVTRHPESHEILIEQERGAWKNGTGIILPPGVGISGLVMSTGMPYLNNDVRNDPRFLRPEIAGYLKAVACVPLMESGVSIGALWIGRHDMITEEELQLLICISEVAAPVLRQVIEKET